MTGDRKTAIEAEARLQAIEYLVRALIIDRLAQTADPVGEAQNLRARLTEMFAGETLGGSDPALSDHAIAEIDAALQVQLDAVVRFLEAGRG